MSTKSYQIILDKLDRCTKLIESGCPLIREYSHTAVQNGKVTDYYHKYILDTQDVKIRLSIEQAEKLIPIADKLGLYKIITDGKMKSRFYNRIKKTTHYISNV